MNEKGAAAKEGAAAGNAENWEERRLCSDGNCIGVIGPDGRCKECGRPEEGPSEQHNPPPVVAAAAAEPPVAAAVAPAASKDPDDDWAQRRLCSDGNCIGVIGPDGRCKECGKPANE